MQVFVDGQGTIIAIHGEDQLIDVHAYDEMGVGETRVIYLDAADVPAPEVIDGSPGPRRMPAGWENGYKPTVPASITSTQGKLALRRAGKLAAAKQAIAGMSDEDAQADAEIKFDAAVWYRSDPLFDQLGAGVGLSSANVDDLFRLARTL